MGKGEGFRVFRTICAHCNPPPFTPSFPPLPSSPSVLGALKLISRVSMNYLRAPAPREPAVSRSPGRPRRLRTRVVFLGLSAVVLGYGLWEFPESKEGCRGELENFGVLRTRTTRHSGMRSSSRMLA